MARRPAPPPPPPDESGSSPTYRFTAPLWRWQGNAAWHFLTLPFEEADDIDERTTGRQGGFGSVRVKVTVGRTTWSTSVFPSANHESYILPVKAAVRKAEGLEEGSPVEVTLQIEALL